MSFKSLMLVISVVVGTVFAGNATARDNLGGETKKESLKRMNEKRLHEMSKIKKDVKWIVYETPQGDDKVRKEEIAVSMPKKRGGIGGGPKELNSFLK